MIFKSKPRSKKSRKFLLTILAHAISGYLASTGNAEAAAILSGIAQGSYNVGQGLEDAAERRSAGIIDELTQGD